VRGLRRLDARCSRTTVDWLRCFNVGSGSGKRRRPRCQFERRTRSVKACLSTSTIHSRTVSLRSGTPSPGRALDGHALAGVASQFGANGGGCTESATRFQGVGAGVRTSLKPAQDIVAIYVASIRRLRPMARSWRGNAFSKTGNTLLAQRCTVEWSTQIPRPAIISSSEAARGDCEVADSA
jgi:hypothetical protein